MEFIEKLKNWLLAIRLKTLTASIVPVVVGSLYALPDFNVKIFVLCLLCAISLQISVNFANDYFDFKKGVDTKERVGPTRVTASGLISLASMKYAIGFFLTLSAILGLTLIAKGGWFFAVLGVLSLCGALMYSGGPFPLASNALGEVTVFIFFGLVAVVGCYYLQTGKVSSDVFMFASYIGLLSSAIMLVNNTRDIVTDRKVEKNTLAVVLGEEHSKKLYSAFIFSPFLVIIYFGLNNDIWWLALLVLVIPSVTLVKLMFKSSGVDLNKVLALTSLMLLAHGLLISAVLLVKNL